MCWEGILNSAFTRPNVKMLYIPFEIIMYIFVSSASVQLTSAVICARSREDGATGRRTVVETWRV